MREEFFDYLDNPAGIMEGTFKRRDVGIDKLENIELELVTNPKPGEVMVDVRVKGEMKKMDAWKKWQGDPYIFFSQPIEVPVGGKLRLIPGAPFFSQNAKMASLSFGIPAGPSSVNGACPASALPDTYKKHYALGDVDTRPMRWDEQICRKCYANKGNFTYELQQVYQTVRYEWILGMLEPGDTEEDLAQELTAAVETATKNVRKRESDGENPLFVRIHDSGDLFDLRYWRAWKKVCESLSDLSFWCPSRMWMLPAYTQEFQKGVPENLALRPSAYHFNEKAPVIEGLAAGSTSNYWETKKGGLKVDPIKSGIADWPCPAYAEVEGKKGDSCRGAIGRVSRVWTGAELDMLNQLKNSMSQEELELTKGCSDCRVCWLRKDWRVSYTAH